MSHILLIDDEPSLVAVLRPVLGAAGYSVTIAMDARSGIAAMAAQQPDIVILDLGLPDMDGQQVITTMRATSDVPIIIISARHQEGEKIAALDGGADDYVNKPFEIGELMARIRAALRRHGAGGDARSSYRHGELTVDLATRHVALAGDPVRLSPKEFALLETLVGSAGQVVTHKRLLIAGWGSEAADSQYLRVYVGLLRQKIEEDPGAPRLILTEPGVGYRLVAPQ
ncbi:response regulator [Sphingomonas sp.]|uniref:response regulator n=1 Tax=Sphingomonas sp. TaxID=28214 RepID=UPI003D6D42ED